ncbi:MAG: hypothetical protein ABJA79_05380 [Parafilimonas sp.]
MLEDKSGVVIKSKTTFTLAEKDGPGSISPIWMTSTGNWRYSIPRFYREKNIKVTIQFKINYLHASGI